MIRRGFWVAVGAAGGIMAYRRVASFGRRISGTPGADRARVTTLGVARETIRFTRDVREGMDDYMARHPGRPAPDGKERHLIGRADNENVKDDR
jgi:hypothetical protein